jgi:hypothetical protein
MYKHGMRQGLLLLTAWIDHGRKPTPAGIATRCEALEPRFGGGCHFDPDYTPRPLAARVPTRERP